MIHFKVGPTSQLNMHVGLVKSVSDMIESFGRGLTPTNYHLFTNKFLQGYYESTPSGGSETVWGVVGRPG